MALFTKFPRLLLRRWGVASTIFHGIDYTGEPQPISVEYRQLVNGSFDEWRLQVNSMTQAAHPSGVPIELRANKYGDAYVANSNVSFYLTGVLPGNTWGFRHYDEFRNEVEMHNDMITDDDGWIDVRQYTRFSLVASATGNFDPVTYGEPAAEPLPLDFNGHIKIEYRNFRHELTEGELLPEALNDPSRILNGPRHVIFDPLNPLDVSGIGWIRVVILTNENEGTCAFFGILK